MPQNKTSTTPESSLRRIDLTNETNQAWLCHPTWVLLIMWGSMMLMTMSTTVIIVLHSAEVVHVPHELWSSLIAGYTLYKRVPLHTSGVCTRTSLQDCSMVFPSLQHTRWGFTGGVSPDHQGPPLAPCGSQESPLPYPLIPNQTDPRESTQSAPPIGTPN
jgi:hypothetical protein